MTVSFSDILASSMRSYEDAIDRAMIPSVLWATRDQIIEASEFAEWRIEQRRLDRLHGQRLGPGPREYRAVMRPVWQRERLLALMPGKRPGAFRRAA